MIARRGEVVRLLGGLFALSLLLFGGCGTPTDLPDVQLTITGRSDLTGAYRQTAEGTRFQCTGYLLEATASGMYGSGVVEWEGATFTWRSLATERTLSAEALSAGETATFWSVPNLPASASTPLKWYDASSTEPFRLTMEFRYRVGRTRARVAHDLTCAEPPPFPLEPAIRDLGATAAPDSLVLELSAKNTSNRTLPEFYFVLDLTRDRGEYHERVGGGTFLLTDPPPPGQTRTWVRRVARVEYDCYLIVIVIESTGERRTFASVCKGAG